MGRKAQMNMAGALCGCGSADVRFNGRSVIKHDHRPTFICGSCGSTFTAGNGSAYAPFVDICDWFNTDHADDFTDEALLSARLAATVHGRCIRICAHETTAGELTAATLKAQGAYGDPAAYAVVETRAGGRIFEHGDSPIDLREWNHFALIERQAVQAAA